MSVQVYGCNHLAIEVDDVEAAVKFYKDVFNLEKMNGGEGDAFLKLGEHQFLAIFEVEEVKPDRIRHFGLIVRDETAKRGAEESEGEVWFEAGTAVSLRFSRSLGQPHPGGRSA
jgi:catechol 2,3-dioxygenase-like lactoylglutathione lyase family enzyme